MSGDDEQRRWQARYGGPEYFYGTEPNDFLREHAAAIAASGRVLSLGEGEGRNAVYLASLGHHVTALDQSAAGLAKALRLAAQREVTIDVVQARLGDYVFAPGAWDGVVSIWCHLPATVRAVVHREIVAALAPGGVFLLESYTPAQIAHGTGGPRDPDLLATLDALRVELAGLVIEHAIERERIVLEGNGHRGLSSVVQFVGRKSA